MTRSRHLSQILAIALVLALPLSTSAAVLTLTLGPDCIPDLVDGVPFSIDITASGGTPPYTYVLASGALPPGMTLASSGTLSGTPTTPGQYTFTVAALDSLGDSGSRVFTLVVMEHWNIVLGEGISPVNANRVHVARIDGSSTGVDFSAYGAGQWGVHVAAGEIAGGASAPADEIITGPGPGTVYGPHVRGFFRDGTVLSKLNFFAYGTLKYGVNVATSELDRDGWDEIVTGAGAGEVFGPHVRGWNYDNTSVSPLSKVNFFAYSTLKYGVNVAGGDVDGDCYGEILTTPGPGAVFGATVRGFNYDGVALTSISKMNFVPFTHTFGANLALGDVDADHFDEIVVTPGPGQSNPNLFVGFDFDGVGVSALPGYTVTPFPTSYGGRAGMAGVGDPAGAIPGGMDLLAAPGPDPTAPAEIKVYAYTGSSLIEIVPPTPISLPGSAYGVNPAGARLGL